MVGIRFLHPAPERPRTPLLPVFLPHAGCDRRCLFCDQHAQTGLEGKSADPEAVLADLARTLAEREQSGRPPVEVGFYGATFTRLPRELPQRFAALAGAYARRGVVAGVRCSTRPDAVAPALLAELAALGLTMVELGVQTFSDAILADVGRGHTGDDARAGCRAVREAGLALGLHLLPGLPGMDEAAFAADVAEAIMLAPEAVRLHPCLVLANTGLHERFLRGAYAPWGLMRAVHALAGGVDAFWSAGVSVIRVGLSPEPSLAAAVVAGPVHPALGQRVRSRALLLAVARHAAALPEGPKEIFHPGRFESDVRGWASELLPEYAALGIAPHNLHPGEGKYFLLRPASPCTLLGV